MKKGKLHYLGPNLLVESLQDNSLSNSFCSVDESPCVTVCSIQTIPGSLEFMVTKGLDLAPPNITINCLLTEPTPLRCKFNPSSCPL